MDEHNKLLILHMLSIVDIDTDRGPDLDCCVSAGTLREAKRSV